MAKNVYTRHSISKFKPSQLEKAFKDADTDGDGCLTKEEYIKVFRDQGVNISGEAADAFFRDKDKDRDGLISLDEFMGQMTMTEKVWNSLDRDRDGLVGLEDASKVVTKYKKSLPEAIVQGLEDAFRQTKKERLNYEDFCQIMIELKMGHNPRKQSGNRSQSYQASTSVNSSRGGTATRKKSYSRQNSLGMIYEPKLSSPKTSRDERTHYSRHF